MVMRLMVNNLSSSLPMKRDVPKDVKLGKAISRKKQLETGIILVSKSWGGKPNNKQDRKNAKKRLRLDQDS